MLISQLAATHSVKSALQEAGYHNTTELLQTAASDLSAELSIPLSQAEDIIRQCRNPPGPSRQASPHRNGHDGHDAASASATAEIQASTAAALLVPQSLPRFSTLSETLDALISQHTCADADVTSEDRATAATGAITPGMAVEISGPPGIGKTAIAIGLALSARMGTRKRRKDSVPQDRGGGEVLIIDTEGAITPDRLSKAAEALTRNTSSKFTVDLSPVKFAVADGIDRAPQLLEGIHLVRVATQVQMVAFLNSLDEWLLEHPKVILILIDSLSYHFRQPNFELNARRRVMDTVKQQIGKATMVHHCAIVLITQMATKLLSLDGKRSNFETGEKAVLMPQLGEMWQNAKTLRVVLFRGPDGNEVRYAHVGTSADSDPNGDWACFDISTDGLPMDVEDTR